jgi:hypothetical protein
MGELFIIAEHFPLFFHAHVHRVMQLSMPKGGDGKPKHPRMLMLKLDPGHTPTAGFPVELELSGQEHYELVAMACFKGDMIQRDSLFQTGGGHFYSLVRVHGRYYKADPVHDGGRMTLATSEELSFMGAKQGKVARCDGVIALCYAVQRGLTADYVHATALAVGEPC